MSPETTGRLKQELENIKRMETRSGYIGGWTGFVISIFTLATMLAYPPEREGLPPRLWWIPALLYAMVLLMMLDSFFIIIKHLINRRIILIIEALIGNSAK